MDITPPIVAISMPKAGAIVPRKEMVEIIVTAGDDTGVVQEVAVFVNRETVCPSLLQAPYRCVWEVPPANNKTYTLQATATDAAGNAGLSAPVQVKSGNVAASTVQATRGRPDIARTPQGKPLW